jgi:hypothetical protein
MKSKVSIFILLMLAGAVFITFKDRLKEKEKTPEVVLEPISNGNLTPNNLIMADESKIYEILKKPFCATPQEAALCKKFKWIRKINEGVIIDDEALYYIIDVNVNTKSTFYQKVASKFIPEIYEESLAMEMFTKKSVHQIYRDIPAPVLMVIGVEGRKLKFTAQSTRRIVNNILMKKTHEDFRKATRKKDILQARTLINNLFEFKKF